MHIPIAQGISCVSLHHNFCPCAFYVRKHRDKLSNFRTRARESPSNTLISMLSFSDQFLDPSVLRLFSAAIPVSMSTSKSLLTNYTCTMLGVRRVSHLLLVFFLIFLGALLLISAAVTVAIAAVPLTLLVLFVAAHLLSVRRSCVGSLQYASGYSGIQQGQTRSCPAISFSGDSRHSTSLPEQAIPSSFPDCTGLSMNGAVC